MPALGMRSLIRSIVVDIEELQTFVEVADAGGISPAAFRLGLAKSIVSRRLVRLEAHLGVQLLSRTTRGAALTEAGDAFRDYAARVCSEIGMARETIAPSGELRGRLRIAAPLTFGPTHFAPVIAEMARRHPLLQVHICFTDQVVNLIGDGYDCAIRVGYLQDSNLVARDIGPVHASAVASPAYIASHGMPATPHELLCHEAVVQGTESWYFMDGSTKVVVRPQGRYKADNGVALVAATLAGIGIGYLPTILVQEHLDSGALVPVLRRYPVPPAGAYLVRPPGQHPAKKIRVLAELLIEHVDPMLSTARAPLGSPLRDTAGLETTLPAAS